MEIDYGDGSDRTWRAAFREGYRRNPRAGELGNYKFWHCVSRTRGFDIAGDWRDWPAKPIPDDARADFEAAYAVKNAGSSSEPAPPEPTPEPEYIEPELSTINGHGVDAPPPAANGAMPKRPLRSIEPRALKRDSKLLAQLDASAASRMRAGW